MESPVLPLEQTPLLGTPEYILPPSQPYVGIMQCNFQSQFKEK